MSTSNSGPGRPHRHERPPGDRRSPTRLPARLKASPPVGESTGELLADETVEAVGSGPDRWAVELARDDELRADPWSSRQPATSGPSTVDLAAPGDKPRRGLVWFLLWLALLFSIPVALAAAAAYVAATYMDEVWAGRSEIMFHLPDLAGDAATRFLATQPVVLRSYPVVEPVAAAEGLSIERLLRHLDATLVQGSTLMRIEYHDGDRERIVRVLEGLTASYLMLLRDVALIEGASHRLLSAPYLLEDRVAPRPFRAAAIGAVAGLAIAFAGLIVLAQTRRPG